MRQAYPNELYHHGIKGQKWGLRRFQYINGSYTPAGRRRYGIFGKKKVKKSDDVKQREADRTKAKNEAARKEMLEAKAERMKAQAEAERAKKELRAAKKENALSTKIIQKIKDKSAANKAAQAEKTSDTKIAQYANLVKSGDKKAADAFARNLNADEYEKAVGRIKMSYNLEKAQGEARIAKAQKVVSGMETGVDMWNATAGIISAFSGKNVPKINTKYQDPLDTLKKQLEVKNKEEALRTTTAGANKAEELARQERIKADTAKRDWDESEAERKSTASRERAEKVVEALKTYHKPTGANSRSFSGLTYKDKLAGKSLPEQQSSINLDSITVGTKKAAKKKADKVFEQTKDIDLKSLMRRSKKSGYRTKDGNIDFSKLPEEEQEMWAQLIRGSNRGAKSLWNM